MDDTLEFAEDLARRAGALIAAEREGQALDLSYKDGTELLTSADLKADELIRGEIEAERRAALDWYAAVRSAYTQYRENLVHDRRRARNDFDYFPGLEIDADRPAQD